MHTLQGQTEQSFCDPFLTNPGSDSVFGRRGGKEGSFWDMLSGRASEREHQKDPPDGHLDYI